MLFQKEIDESEVWDVVVCGGGPAGIGAACAAAREGAETLLLELSGCLGGVSSNCELPFWLGGMKNGKAINGGIFGELVHWQKEQYGRKTPAEKYRLEMLALRDEIICRSDDLKLFFDRLLRTAGVKCRFFTRVVDAVRKDNRITHAIVANKAGIHAVRGRFFIDCTGDADLTSFAGFATYREKICAPVSVIWQVEGIQLEQFRQYFVQGADRRFRKLIREQRAAGNWSWPDPILSMFPLWEAGAMLVNGGMAQVNLDGCSPADLSRAMQTGREMIDHILNRIMRPLIPGMRNAFVRKTAAFPGVRETRKIVGKCRLTEEMLLSGATPEKIAALSSYHFDLGRPERQTDGSFLCEQPKRDKRELPGMAMIPLGCLEVAEAANLMAAGRCIDAEGQALGPVRVMAPCMAMGEAAGREAARCLIANRS